MEVTLVLRRNALEHEHLYAQTSAHQYISAKTVIVARVREGLYQPEILCLYP